MEEYDIRCAAKLLIAMHGDHAKLAADRYADWFLDQGDLYGCNVWKQVRWAIHQLSRQKASSSEPLN